MFNNKFTKKDNVADVISQVIESWDDDDEDDDVRRADAELKRMKAKPIEADKKTDPDKEIGKLAKKTPKEVDESVEQIDELSTSTMGSYMQKSIAQKLSGTKDRTPGMQKAYKKMTTKKVSEDQWSDISGKESDWKPSKRTPSQAMSAAHNLAGKGLKGAQHKLDVAEPKGKLTGADFKKLRKEDAEQIDELSKKTLANYMRANTKRMADPKNPDSMERKMKRHDDYFKASKKFHEETDLEESWDKGVSKSYISDSVGAVKQKKKAAEHLSNAKRHPEGSAFHNDYMAKHHSALAKYIKHSYHSGQYGSQEDAKKDYKKHMSLSKSFKSGKVDESYTGKGNHKPGWMLKADPKLAQKLKDAKSAARPPLSSPSKEYSDKIKKEETVSEAQGPTSTYGADANFVPPENTTSSPVLARIKALTKGSMKRLNDSMLGKAGATSEEIDPSVKTTDTLKGRIKGGKKDDVGPGADGKSTKVKYTPGPK